MEEKARIDTSAILENLDSKITEGLRNGEYTLTDISLLISSAIEDTHKKIMSDVEKIIETEKKENSTDTCLDCGKALKKTVKATKKKQ